MKRIFIFIVICISYVTVYAENRNEGQVPFLIEQSDGQATLMSSVEVPLNYLRIQGWVRGLLNNEPVPNCTMRIEVDYSYNGICFSGEPQTQSTDSNGHFCFYVYCPSIWFMTHVLSLGGVDIRNFNPYCNYCYGDWIYEIRI